MTTAVQASARSGSTAAAGARIAEPMIAEPTTAELRARLPIASVRRLRVAYTAGELVLDGVDLDLFPGEMVALLGSSGSGKSTLMKSLTGFAPITSGSVRVAGYDVANLQRGQLRELRANAGQVFQQFNLIGRLSVLTNVLTGALHHAGRINLVGGFSRADRVRAMELLDRVGIAHKAAAPARSLSGGQQQRVAIARALMQQPRVILADEPVASLDPRMSDSVLELLRGIAREDGIPVLVSLHVLDLAVRHSDRIVGLKHGEVVVAAPTAQLPAADLAVVYEQEEERDVDDLA
ncbi:MAG: phosphonate ABC transporter ATP-binding protein [Microbacteriaceae bacterium]|jgi:phosphonate transport system ATP-binding protein|nr:phosphonate ABC transporter ATP-binding protein [Microbacteriaceae bacterium]HPZ34502.1 phosphonate ABC transporter ATP-binding protein [Microbacteriaceae bacterium]HQC93345.1 phosphonate ABC transporter ATP-binding protein [Microbacteriaceae bacterium]